MKEKKIIAVTHSGPFHADDVFAAACIFLAYSDTDIELIRSRDESVIQQADIVFDVGMVYDEAQMRFDHHQEAGAGKRENGIPYSSCGLVWKKFGLQICRNDQRVWQSIDEKIVSPIDALDNGMEIMQKIKPEYPRYFTIHDVIKNMRPLWNESGSPDFDSAFMRAVTFAHSVLKGLLSFEESKKQAREIVEEAYRSATDKQVIILSRYAPWERVLSEYSKPLFVVYPNQNNTYWNAEVVHDDPDDFASKRASFPEEWAGLRDTELQRVSGVVEAVFTHKGLFLAIAETKEAVLEMVHKSL